MANLTVLEAPMPCNIISIKVKAGERVEFEQPLVIFEALKMENELTAPHAGIVKEIHVATGSSVDAGQPIITLEQGE